VSPSLSGKQRRYLSSLGHSLQPVVQIGHAGLTQAVLKALDAALGTHELIKVRVLAEKNAEVRALVPEVESSCKACVAHVVGHTLLVYRRNPKKPKIELPVDKPAKAKRPSKPEKE